MGLVLSDSEYKERHNNTPFPAYLTRPGAYPTVDADETVGKRAEKEATHKAKAEDWKIIDCAHRKVCAFIIASVEDT